MKAGERDTDACGRPRVSALRHGVHNISGLIRGLGRVLRESTAQLSKTDEAWRLFISPCGPEIFSYFVSRVPVIFARCIEDDKTRLLLQGRPPRRTSGFETRHVFYGGNDTYVSCNEVEQGRIEE